MRYFELTESKAPEPQDEAVTVSGMRKKTKSIRIPAGAGPVQVYIRDGEIFVISDRPLAKEVLP